MGLLSKNRLNGKADKNCGFERRSQLIGNENVDILQKVVAYKSNIDDIKPSLVGAKKRPAPDGMEHQVSKRQKLVGTLKQQCSSILQELITHPAGWVFGKPVDPVSLEIPDYFSIISDPMDLGTIRANLDNNKYASSVDFASDVRLTFSNAMLYNPPANDVHALAKALLDIFEERWKSMEAKLKCERRRCDQVRLFNGVKEIQPFRHACAKKTEPQCKLVKKSVSFEEKQRLKSQLLEILMGKIPSDIRGCLQKLGLLSRNQDRINKRIDALDNKSLWELKGVIATCCTEDDRVKRSVTLRRCGLKSSEENIHKGIVPNNHQCASDDKPHSRLQAAPKCDSCGFGSCYCSRIRVSNEASCVGEALYSNVKQSPGKADRVAMLKQRFAGIIRKAQHKTLLDHSGNADHHKPEEEQLSEKKWHGGDAGEPTIKLEAQINAAKNIMRKRARADARHALEEVERTVDFCDNLKVIKDLEMLSGCRVGYSWYGAFEGSHHVRPLERIGLFIKGEYWGDDDIEEYTYGEVGEEGEILD